MSGSLAPARRPAGGRRVLYRWFADAAALDPGATALEAEGRVISYGELSALANCLAGRVLLEHGGVPQRVGLYAARTVAAYAGYLATLHLGATVVPLNPGYPAERNARILRASGASVVLTDAVHQRQAEAIANGCLLVAFDDADEAVRAPRPLPVLPAVPGDLDAVAYLLFTSGSTGAPKGVPVLHRNVDSYLRHVSARYDLGPGARVANLADLTFDISVFELFAVWGTGATVVAPRSQDDLFDPVRFANEYRLTHWHSVPSAISIARRLRRLVPGSMPGIRCSLFIGEALTLPQAAAWADAAPNSVIHNTYGPTEATVMCSAFELPGERDAWPATSNETVPIGECFPEVQYAVLDEDGKAAAEGELLLRGAQLFCGYLDPACNAGRFTLLDDSGNALPGAGPEITQAHWYRTGDRVRHEHGTLVHLGRLDHQVKIRGFRVELGEIEATLRRHPRVGDVVVLAEPGCGETELVAHYTGAEAAEPELRSLVRAHLPGYMHPRYYRAHRSFPLNANGKTDRSKLAAVTTASAGTPSSSRDQP